MLKIVTCLRCNHKWATKIEPRTCAGKRCRTAYWNTPKKVKAVAVPTNGALFDEHTRIAGTYVKTESIPKNICPNNIRYEHNCSRCRLGI